jgi:hypothetical protein
MDDGVVVKSLERQGSAANVEASSMRAESSLSVDETADIASGTIVEHHVNFARSVEPASGRHDKRPEIARGKCHLSCDQFRCGGVSHSDGFEHHWRFGLLVAV